MQEPGASVPGPAGLLQAALDQGLIPASLSDLSAELIGQKASQILHEHDVDFLSPSWLRACSDQQVDSAFETLTPASNLVPAGRVCKDRLRCAGQLLTIVDGVSHTASGDAFVSLKVCCRSCAHSAFASV